MVTIATLVYVPYDSTKEGGLMTSSWSVTSRTVFETLSRTLWAIALGWIVYACNNHSGGMLSLSLLYFIYFLLFLNLIFLKFYRCIILLYFYCYFDLYYIKICLYIFFLFNDWFHTFLYTCLQYYLFIYSYFLSCE